MNKFILALFWTLSLMSIQANAESRPVEPLIPFPEPFPELFPEPSTQTAVNINIGSMGGAIDDAVIRTVRKVVGHAVATGAVDFFVVTSPSNNNIMLPIEGGLSFCAEAGFNGLEFEFTNFIDELKSIQPNEGTFYNINLVDHCPVTVEIFDDEDISCAEFSPCPEIIN